MVPPVVMNRICMPCYHDTMTKYRRVCATLASLALLIVLPFVAHADSKVVILEIEGGIGVAQSDYLSSGLEHAHSVGADLVLLKLDTPGGLVVSTEDMIQEILASPVPVATLRLAIRRPRRQCRNLHTDSEPYRGNGADDTDRCRDTGITDRWRCNADAER